MSIRQFRFVDLTFKIVILIFFGVMIFPLCSCDYEPYRQGKNLYDYYCANCHMEKGQGLRGLYPPLAQSDYLENNQEKIACIIKYGISETIVVNGNTYNQPMAAIPNLSDVEITNIINYINHAWGNDLPVRKVKNIKKELKACQEE